MKNSILIFFIFALSCNSSSVKEFKEQKNNNTNRLSTDNDIVDLYEIDKEIIKNPKSPNVYLKRALYYQKKRDFLSALEDINRALSITPDISFLKYHKAAILYELAVNKQDISLLDESKIYLDNCIEEDLEIIAPRLLRAKIFLFEKKTDQAMKLVNDVLKINQIVAEAYLIKGMIYHFLGNNNLASSSYQTALEVDPSYYDAYIHMGMISENSNNYNSIDYYNSAIEIEPNNIEAHRNKGLYYHFRSNYVSARKAFKKIIEIDSNFEETYFNIGNTFLGQFDRENRKDEYLDSAFFYFSRAIEINPYYVQSIHNIGLCYEIRGKIDLAKKNYQKAINLDNNFQPSLNAINLLN